MCSLSYSATVFKVEAFLRKLEQSEVVEGGVFVDGNRKKKEKIIFKWTHWFKLELLPGDLEGWSWKITLIHNKC